MDNSVRCAVLFIVDAASRNMDDMIRGGRIFAMACKLANKGRPARGLPLVSSTEPEQTPKSAREFQTVGRQTHFPVPSSGNDSEQKATALKKRKKNVYRTRNPKPRRRLQLACGGAGSERPKPWEPKPGSDKPRAAGGLQSTSIGFRV